MLAVLVDEHVNDAIVAAFRQRGCDVLAPKDRGLQGTPDDEFLELAHVEQRVVFTNDHDFLVIATSLQQQQATFAPIVFWPQQARTIAELLNKTIPLLQTSKYSEICSQVFFH